MRRQQRLAASSRPNYVQEFLQLAIFEHISLRPYLNGLFNVTVRSIHRKDHDGTGQRAFVKAPDYFDAAEAGHDHIEHQYVGLKALRLPHRLDTVASLTHDFKVGLRRKQSAQSLAYHIMIIGDDYGCHACVLPSRDEGFRRVYRQ